MSVKERTIAPIGHLIEIEFQTVRDRYTNQVLIDFSYLLHQRDGGFDVNAATGYTKSSADAPYLADILDAIIYDIGVRSVRVTDHELEIRLAKAAEFGKLTNAVKLAVFKTWRLPGVKWAAAA